MISELRLAQIIAVITELSEQKKQDFYRFLLDIKKKCETIIDDEDVARLLALIEEIQRGLANKVDKVQGKGLSTNDFTNTLRNKLLNIKGNVQANWNTTEETDGSYILNKPNLNGFEVTNNKVTTISSLSTDNQYPSAKCVYDIVGDIEDALDEILN